MKKEWFLAAWRVAILCLLVWIGNTLENISSGMYTGPSEYDDQGRALSRMQKSIDELNTTMDNIAKFGAGWR